LPFGNILRAEPARQIQEHDRRGAQRTAERRWQAAQVKAVLRALHNGAVGRMDVFFWADIRPEVENVSHGGRPLQV
jgi:hypothetical protein